MSYIYRIHNVAINMLYKSRDTSLLPLTESDEAPIDYVEKINRYNYNRQDRKRFPKPNKIQYHNQDIENKPILDAYTLCMMEYLYDVYMYQNDDEIEARLNNIKEGMGGYGQTVNKITGDKLEALTRVASVAHDRDNADIMRTLIHNNNGTFIIQDGDVNGTSAEKKWKRGALINSLIYANAFCDGDYRLKDGRPVYKTAYYTPSVINVTLSELTEGLDEDSIEEKYVRDGDILVVNNYLFGSTRESANAKAKNNIGTLRDIIRKRNKRYLMTIIDFAKPLDGYNIAHKHFQRLIDNEEITGVIKSNDLINNML